MRQILSTALICLFAAGITPASDYPTAFYREVIEESRTTRQTRIDDSSGSVWWQQTLPGNPEFGSKTTRLEYVHSVLDIDPPLLPDGIIRCARLKLYLRNHASDDIEVTVDSLELDQKNRRHFLIGPSVHDTISVQDSPLRDGQIVVELTSDDDDQFQLYRSVFDVRYIPSLPTDVDESQTDVPVDFVVSHNYPNPFNPSTTIEYSLAAQADVRIDILDLLGRVVRVLVNEPMPAGAHTVVWDGKGIDGVTVATGVYFYRITTGEFTEVRKMILLK
ncbi:MAG: T9SS type A sorting domain-containing protein [Candidatus Zixiibacteriota bacterium]